MAATPASGAGLSRAILIGVAVLLLVAALVWGGTQRAVEAVRPADVAYLKHNKAEPGVVTTASGLQYQVLRPGSGAHPLRSDTVAVHYEGKLVDNTVFDSSYQRGQPAVFPLDQVIPGWTEGLQLMQPGAKFRFVIPSVLGYGSAGSPGAIPPNAVLRFDVELLAVRGKS